jgi:hypothetical protein
MRARVEHSIREGGAQQILGFRGSGHKDPPQMVEVKGLEPSTYGLQSRRSSS